MLSNLLQWIERLISDTGASKKALPAIRLELVDLILEERDEQLAFGIDDEYGPPSGLEFRYLAFNGQGDMVCSGKVTQIPGLQLIVCGINTPKEHRRKGYGSATIKALFAAFESLPIAPMDERGDGLAFWPAVRQLFEGEVAFFEQTCLTNSITLCEPFRKAGRCFDYTPSSAKPLVKNGK